MVSPKIPVVRMHIDSCVTLSEEHIKAPDSDAENRKPIFNSVVFSEFTSVRDQNLCFSGRISGQNRSFSVQVPPLFRNHLALGNNNPKLGSMCDPQFSIPSCCSAPVLRFRFRRLHYGDSRLTSTCHLKIFSAWLCVRVRAVKIQTHRLSNHCWYCSRS